MNASIKPPKPSDPISESTVKQYLVVAGRLVKRARVESGILDGPLPLTRVVEFLQIILPTIKRRTFRFYKAALAYHFKALGAMGDSSKALVLLDKLSKEEVGAKVVGRRTSSQKSKQLSLADLSAIKEALRAMNTTTANQTLLWLIASLLTGLRPREWCGAELISTGSVTELKVRNLKNTQGRSFGETRSMELFGIEKLGLAAIKKHLVLFREGCIEEGVKRIKRVESDTDTMYRQKCFDAGYEPLYTRCRQLLSSTVRKIFEGRKLHITLSSGRHQFAANAKSTYDRGTVAALLGHGGLETAGRHYGLSAKGGSIKVKPLAETRQAVLKKNAAKGMSTDIVYRPVVTKKDPQLPKPKPKPI